MNRKRSKKSKFPGTSLIIGSASVLLVILITTYFFDKDNLDYEESKFGVLLDEPRYYSESEIPEWHTINTGKFTIQTPKDYKFFRLQGIDSYVAGLTNKQDTFYFDYGLYSNSLESLSAPDYKVIFELIQGKNFRMVIGQGKVNFIAAYTDQLPKENSLMIECPNCSNLEEKRKIIETIKF